MRKLIGCTLILISSACFGQVLDKEDFLEMISTLNDSGIIDSLVYENLYSEGNNLFIEKDSIFLELFKPSDDQNNLDLENRKVFFVPEVDLFHYGIERNIKFLKMKENGKKICIYFKLMEHIFKPSSWTGKILISRKDGGDNKISIAYEKK